MNISKLAELSYSLSTGIDRMENMTFKGVNMDPLSTSEIVAFKPDIPFFQCKQSVILSHANIIPWVKAGAPLTNYYISWYNLLHL
jgi:hypothetical protein